MRNDKGRPMLDGYEQRREQVHDAVNKAHKLLESWDQRLTLTNLRLIERYLDREFDIIVALVAKSGGEQNDAAGHDRFVGGVECERFVHNVELVKSPKRVIPSFVWLERVEDVKRVFADSLCISRSAGFVLGFRLPDRECRPALLRLSAVGDHELSNEVIKNRPGVVDHVARNQQEARRDRFGTSDAVLPLTGLRVALDDDFVGIGLEEPLEREFQIAEVFLGPFELSLSAA